MAHLAAATVVAAVMERDIASKANDLEGSNQMNATFRKLSALAIAFSASVAISAAYAQGKGKGKAKGKQDVETKENHGRGAGELPYGLEQFSEKKGGLPSGLQKKKDDEGKLTRGLADGGKRLEPKGKAKKASK